MTVRRDRWRGCAAFLFDLLQRSRRQAQRIKRLPGGVFSAWAIDELRAGDVLEVMPPVGEFTIDPDPATPGHRVAIAAGSGITPVLSLIATTLEIEPDSSWTSLREQNGQHRDVPRGFGGLEGPLPRPFPAVSLPQPGGLRSATSLRPHRRRQDPRCPRPSARRARSMAGISAVLTTW